MSSVKSHESCCFCRMVRATAPCGICAEPVCRKCELSPPPGAFVLMPEVPETLAKPRYCPGCYDAQVAPALAEYEETEARAREVIFITQAYRGQLPLIRKAVQEVNVPACEDRDELIMKLAFLAAREGYNSLIRSEVVRKKVRNHAYQKSEWSGHGIPAVVDEARLRLDEYREEVWRRGQ